MQPFEPMGIRTAAMRLANPTNRSIPVTAPVPPLHARYRILVVDDMSVSRGVIAQSLEMLDCRNVVVAGDAKTALASMREHPVDLVLSDYLMPLMTGLEFLGRIRRSPEISHTRFVLVTGAQEPGLERQAAALGVSAILWKPYGLRDLRSLIERVMGRRMPALRSTARNG